MIDPLCEIVRQIAAVTGRAAADIDPDQPFAAMGIESLEAVAIAANLGEKLGVSLDATTMFDYPNVRRLAEYLADPGRAASAGAPRAAAGAGAPAEAHFEPIAVIGMACHFPGARAIDAFWRLLEDGVDAISDVPRSRWEGRPRAPAQGGFVDGIDEFDHEAFGIPEPEAVKMDPQQRLLMQAAWTAIEDAGYAPSGLARSRTGVFVGIGSNDYSLVRAQAGLAVDVYDATGNAHSIAANRLSYAFDLRGPSVAVDTACSSSLVALHLACTALRMRECDLALGAGVNLIITPDLSEAFAAAQMLSPGSRCRSFSSRADGYVRGEGAGVVVLKRLSDAVRDRDPIWAMVRGSAVNQDGRSASLTAPNGPAQEEVIRAALAAARVEPVEIGYVEAHGTGTPLGDPIEFLSLSRVMGTRAAGQTCRVGSVKTNIGHLEAAAGIAGVIKTVLALKHRWIPCSLHCDEINPRVGDRCPNLTVARGGAAWETAGRRLAGVSSFGFGGTNAHVILEEYTGAPDARPEGGAAAASPGRLFLCASASDRDGVRAMAKAYRARLEGLSPEAAHAVADASGTTRMDLPHRLIVHVRDAPELETKLAAFLSGKLEEGMVYVHRRRGGARKLAFLFTGQGAQYPGMGAGLHAEFPTYREAFDQCCEGFDRLLERDLFALTIGESAGADQDLFRTDYGQATIFATGYALARLLQVDFGVTPAAVFGHSVGEIIASCVAGAVSLPDAIRLVAARGTLMQRTPDGRMLAVFAPEADVRAWVQASGGQLDLAAVNGPSLMIASGERAAVDRLEVRLAESGVKHTRLKNTRGFHSALMDGALEPFERAAGRVVFGAPTVPLVSSLTGEPLAEPQNARYWRRHLREPTRFLQAMLSLDAQGCTGMLEIGPRPTLVPMGRSCLPDTKTDWFTTLAPDRDAAATVYQCLAELAAGGYWKIPSRVPRNGARPGPTPPFTIFRPKSLWAHARSGPGAPGPETVKPVEPPLADGGTTVDAGREQRVLTDLTAIVASLLDVAPANVDVDEPLVDTGADSLLLLNAIQTVKDKYQVAIAISDVFQELSTVRKLAGYVAARMAPEPARAAAPAALAAMQAEQLTPVAPVMTPVQVSFAGFATPVGDVRAVVDQQLKLMALQLQLLGGASAGNPVTAAPAPAAHAAPGQPQERKGVLGNFATRANVENLRVEDGVKDRYLASLMARFTARTAKSKALVGQFRPVLADNRVSAGFRPNLKEMVYPIICERAKGSRFHDLDGNEYIDVTMGFGVNLFGHSPAFIESAITEQIGRGMCVGPQSSLAGPVAKKVTEITGMERVAFLNSGTEAVMTAIRLARAATGRNKLVLFDGSYHGHFDGVLARPKDGGSVPVAPGVTPGFVQDVMVLEYGTPEALAAIRRHAGEIAAVIVEPVQSRYPELQPGDFLREVRAITERAGAALIFDEVITGFRIRPGGAQEHFGVRADLASYGKILGGGMPIGAVGGKAKYMDFIDGGGWEFGDRSYPKNEMTFFAGTFCKHPLAMAAANAVLDRMKAEGASLIADLNQRTGALAATLNAFFESRGLDLRCNTFGSLFRFKAPANLDLLFYNLNLRGAYVWEGRNMFLSTAHSDEDVQAFVKIVEASIDELIEHGILKVAKAAAERPESRVERALIAPQQRFKTLVAKGADGEAASHVCVAVKMKGPLQIDHLWPSLEAVMERSDAFRLRFDLAKGVQRLESATELRHGFSDLTEADSTWKELDRRLREEGRRRFDLARDPPIRFHLFRMGEENAILSMVCHHIALDGWSIAQFIEDVAKVYRERTGGPAAALKPAMAFADFLDHPERFGTAKKMEAARAFWEEQFPEAPPPIRLSGGSPPTAGRLEGERHVLDLPPDVHKKVKAAAKVWKMSPLVLLLTGFGRLMAEIDPQGTCTLGVPAGNRDLEGADRMVGSCANLLPVRLSPVIGEDAEESCKKTKTALLVALAHMVHPYEELEAKVGRPLFNVSFNLEPMAELPDFGDVTLFIHPYPITVAEFDLTVNLSDLEYFYHVEADYRLAAVGGDKVAAWVQRYGEILDQMLKV